MKPEFRAATAGDLEAIRDLQIESWRWAYCGLLPEEFLSHEVPHVLAERWAALPGTDWWIHTAWMGGRLAGFISLDGARAQGAYIDNLHVARWAQGKGLGRALMARAAGHVLACGGDCMWLTVIRENLGTRAFYARLGGIEGAGRAEPLYGQTVFALPVRWIDLPRLARHAEPE